MSDLFSKAPKVTHRMVRRDPREHQKQKGLNILREIPTMIKNATDCESILKSLYGFIDENFDS